MHRQRVDWLSYGFGRHPSQIRVHRPLVALIVAGALLEMGLMAIIALSFQLTETPTFTEAVAPRGGTLWAAIFPILALLDRVHPHIVGPERTREATVAVLPLVFGLASLGYVSALLAVSRRGVPVGLVLGFAVLFQATLLLMPGVYSSDVFSYAIYGRLAAVHGLNPYVTAPDAVASDPLMAWVGWPHLLTPYGPLWTSLSWALATLTRASDPVAHAYAYKLLMNAVQFANVGLVWWLLCRLNSNVQTRLSGLVLLAWNPLVLLETAGSAHNDAVMALLVLIGLVPLAKLAVSSSGGYQRQDRRSGIAWLVALGCVTLAVLIKYLPIFIALMLGCAWVAQQRSWRGRLSRVAAASLVALVLTALLSWPWAAGVSGSGPIATVLAGGDGRVNSLRDATAHWFATRVLPQNAPDARSAHTTAHAIVDALARGIFGLYLVYWLRRVWVRHSAGRLDLPELVRASTSVVLAVLLLLMVQVLAWYFVTPLALASLLGGRSVLAQVTAAMTLTFLPVYYLRHYAMGPDELLGIYVVVPLLIPVVAFIWPRLRGLRSTYALAPAAPSAD